MQQPLVSIICLCYNHAQYVEEAMRSVLDQTYRSIELIVVDDASTDSSVSVIETFVKLKAQVIFIRLDKNIGNCAAFNVGFARSKGEYIIDLSADDVLLANRVEEGIHQFEQRGIEFGVQFCDARLINSEGQHVGVHSQKYPHQEIPQGDIYNEVIKRYFICSPTMLIRREVMEKLNGYDESLAYEDFDFWVRSSRLFSYMYAPEVLVKRRILSNSMRIHQFRKGSKQLQSTFRICEKIKKLNRTTEENNSLKRRIKYEIAVCLRLFEIRLTMSYIKLLLSL